MLFQLVLLPTPGTTTVADPAQSSWAEPSGSSDGGPAAAAELRRAVVVPDLLRATAAANLPADGLRSPALAEPDSVSTRKATALRAFYPSRCVFS